MSFSQDVKREITLLDHSDCCYKYLLLGVIKGTGTLAYVNGKWALNIKTTQAFVARFIIKIMKKLELDRDLNYEETNQFKQTTKIIITLPNANLVGEKIGHFESLKFLSPDIKSMKICCRRSYFAGMFLVAGSINSPKTTNYHFEITTFNLDTLYFVNDLLKSFEISSKVITRKSSYHTLYVKKSGWISDILKLLGAVNAVHKFEDARIQRDMRVSIQRLNNTEISNREKSIASCKKQLDEIKRAIDNKGKFFFSEFDQAYMKVREENQEDSIVELCELLSEQLGIDVSKSKLNHSILKIRKYANENTSK